MISLRLKNVLLAAAVIGSAGEALATAVDIRVNASTDDASQTSAGTMNLTETQMSIQSLKWHGFRFNSVTIPQGAYIISAYVTFRSDDVKTATTDTTIFGENVNSPTTYTTTSSDISNRAGQRPPSVGRFPAGARVSIITRRKSGGLFRRL